MKVGIIGAGNIAETQYLPTLKRLGIRHIFLHDVNEERTAKLAKKYNVSAVSLEYLLHNSEIIFLTTPPETHFSLLLSIIPNAKRVVCEKPFVYRVQEAQQLISLSEQYNCQLHIAHIKRIFPAISLAKKTIAENRFGNLLKAEIFDGTRFNYQSKSGYTFHNKAGGVLLDAGSHAIDCLLYSTGLENAPIILSVLETQKDKSEPAQEFSASFRINGIDIKLLLSRYAVLANKMNLYFEHATLEIPLGLKPFIRCRTASESSVIQAQEPVFNYVSHAFKRELEIIMYHNNKAFNASSFLNLTHLLEKLYYHNT